MATEDQAAFLRSLEAEKDDEARGRAARAGRYTRRARAVVAPSGSSGGYPTALTTGPAAGTVFTNTSGEITTSGAGQTLEKLNITNGYVIIRHANCILQDCIVDMTGQPLSSFQAISASGSSLTGIKIRRCRVIGNAAKDTIQTEMMPGVEISYNDLSKMENGISIGADNGNIHDNYIHDLLGSGVPHVDGIQGTGLFNGLTINHNTIISSDTSCIIMQTEFGGFSNLTVSNNRLLYDAPMSFGMLIQEKPGSPGAVTNVIVTNNRIKFPVSHYAVFHNVNGLSFTGNVDDDTGAPITYQDDGGNTPL